MEHWTHLRRRHFRLREVGPFMCRFQISFGCSRNRVGPFPYPGRIERAWKRPILTTHPLAHTPQHERKAMSRKRKLTFICDDCGKVESFDSWDEIERSDRVRERPNSISAASERYLKSTHKW